MDRSECFEHDNLVTLNGMFSRWLQENKKTIEVVQISHSHSMVAVAHAATPLIRWYSLIVVYKWRRDEPVASR
jgi:hypothetical protein